MIDIKLILDQPELVEASLKKRMKTVDLSPVKSLAKSRLELIESMQSIRTKANEIASSIPSASEDAKVDLIKEGKSLKEEVKEVEAKLQSVEDEISGILEMIPNILQDDVPEGRDDSDNVELRKFMEPTEFSFKPKDHLDLGEDLGIIDMERAAKVSGSRFAYLKGDAVMLEFALIQFALTELIKEGFVPVIPPHIISTKAMGAMGYLAHGGEEEVYHLKNDEAVLIGTSEQSLGPMHMDEILEEKDLPLRYVGVSPCYRREAGSYGKDTRGMIRVHQFNKVEMFSFTTPDKSKEEHEFLLAMQEKLMQALELPYRVVVLCGGDTGTPSTKTYDIETWMPSQNTYRETHSTSNTTDYQTRRLNIRIKQDDKNIFAHALNGTAFALSRTPVAIMENYQQEDGRILVPKVLRPWIPKEYLDGK